MVGNTLIAFRSHCRGSLRVWRPICAGLQPLSTALFNDGATCSSCFELMCVKSKAMIRITDANFCPPNYTKTHDIRCNPPQKHFDLALSMFTQIAIPKASIIPVVYHRVLCDKHSG